MFGLCSVFPVTTGVRSYGSEPPPARRRGSVCSFCLGFHLRPFPPTPAVNMFGSAFPFFPVARRPSTAPGTFTSHPFIRIFFYVHHSHTFPPVLPSAHSQPLLPLFTPMYRRLTPLLPILCLLVSSLGLWGEGGWVLVSWGEGRGWRRGNGVGVGGKTPSPLPHCTHLYHYMIVHH